MSSSRLLGLKLSFADPPSPVSPPKDLAQVCAQLSTCHSYEGEAHNGESTSPQSKKWKHTNGYTFCHPTTYVPWVLVCVEPCSPHCLRPLQLGSKRLHTMFAPIRHNSNEKNPPSDGVVICCNQGFASMPFSPPTNHWRIVPIYWTYPSGGTTLDFP